MPNKPHDAGTKAASKSSRRKATPADDVNRDDKGKFKDRNKHSWKPGQSGNPAGRPKHKTLSEAYRDKLAEQCELDPSMTWAEYIATQQVMAAAGLKTDNSFVPAARELADRTEGKPKQPIALDVKDEAKRLLAMLLGVDENELPDPE
jgi:hypothetical protein